MQTNSRLITETPTLYPSMLLGRSIDSRWPPFHGGNVHWYYLARNAVFESVRVLGLAGREVLMPSYHHGVEVAAVAAAGARPVFYRVTEDWRVDLADLRSRITTQTAALYLTHFAGFPGPVHEFRQLAFEHELALIEDCALSLFSSVGDQPVGQFGDVSIFCLYKSLPVPGGGALCINTAINRQVLQTNPPPRGTEMNLLASSLLKNFEMRAGRTGRMVRSLLRTVGRSAATAAGARRIPVGTMQFEMDNVHLGITPSALSIAQRQSPERIVAARRRNYRLLETSLRDCARPLRSNLDEGVCPLFFPIWVEDKRPVVEQLHRDGIEAIDFWSVGHPACDEKEFPQTARARRHVLEIPCHQDLDPAAVNWVADRVRVAVIESGQDVIATGEWSC
jgi:perosamine synthetase